MNGGYVALLDVLGFTALVAGDSSGEKIRQYLDCLGRATENSEVDYVVFSDSIVLTAKGDGPESLLAVAGACSRLLADLLNESIPLRGAIVFGDFFRSRIAESVFVAGRAVIDAYQFEQAQNWVGIMVAPSALQRVPDLNARCRLLEYNTREQIEELLRRLSWAAYIQPCHGIPFRTSSPFENRSFDGFAVVPTNSDPEPAALGDSIKGAMERLTWLRSVAPSPEAQQKYRETSNWLSNIRQLWERLAHVQKQFALQNKAG